MILIGTGSVGLIPFPERFRFASASKNARTFANDLPIGVFQTEPLLDLFGGTFDKSWPLRLTALNTAAPT